MSKTFKSEGIVLRTLNYAETSVIMDIYTERHGLASFIVSGVRKSKSRMGYLFRPMNIITMVAYLPGEQLARVKEGSYAHHYMALDRDVVRSSIGTFFIDLARNCIKEKEPNPSLYHFLRSTLIDLDTTTHLKAYPIRLALALAAHLGLQLSNDHSDSLPYFDLEEGHFISDDTRGKYVLNGNRSRALHLCLSGHSDTLNKLERKLVLDDLINYYRLHVYDFKELRSLPVLRTILG